MSDGATAVNERGRSPVSGKTLVLFPSMRNSESILAAIPYLRYFGERILCELAALRDPRTRILFVSAEKIDGWILDRTLRDLSAGDERALADMSRRLECLVPNAPASVPLEEAVLGDPSVLTRIESGLKGSRSSLLVNFAASGETDELAARLGIPVSEGPADVVARWGTKAGGKALFRECGVLCPRGDLAVERSIDAATVAARRLAVAEPPPRRMILRLNDDWGSGYGNAILRSDILMRTGDLRRAVEWMALPWEAYCSELQNGGLIVEEYIENATGWPSAQGMIGGDGQLTILAMHEQLMVDGEYRGCRFPIDSQIARSIHEGMTRVGALLSRHGVKGSFGVDFLVAGGNTYATEINLRKVGPNHVIKAVRDLYAVPADTADDGSIIGLPLSYVHRKHHKPQLYSALTPESAHEALRRAGLGYSPTSRTGTLLHIMGGLRTGGYVETTAVASNALEADHLDRQADTALADAARMSLRTSR